MESAGEIVSVTIGDQTADLREWPETRIIQNPMNRSWRESISSSNAYSATAGVENRGH